VRANAIRPYIWRFQGEAWVSPDQIVSGQKNADIAINSVKMIKI
jgi:hypothetical protein